LSKEIAAKDKTRKQEEGKWEKVANLQKKDRNIAILSLNKFISKALPEKN
jgi:hypothetical protein